jgi:hypothetical protein
MISIIKKSLLVGGIAIITTTASFAQDVLTNKEITNLQIAKVSQDIILAKISSSKCNFDLTPQGIIALDLAKVTDRVIKAMFVASPAKISLHNDDIIRIAQSDVSTSVLREAIKLSPHTFDVSPEALINLKTQKVPDSVVKDMIINPSSGIFSNSTEEKTTNTNTVAKVETAKPIQSQGKEILVTNAFEEVKGLKRVGEFKATVQQIFGSQDKLRTQAMDKVKKDAQARGVTHLLIQSDTYAPSPTNTVTVICVGYK